MAENLAVDVISVDFTIVPQPIQYKRLQPHHFSWASPDTHYEVIEPDPTTGYVSEELYKTLSKDFENSNTCIINIGVGRGKTTTACNIIDYYARQEQYVVILASPFKKLVQRDYKNITERKPPYKVVNYEILENAEVEIEDIAHAQVHIMTINSLMFNPGEDNLQITWRKRNYCEAIQEYARKNNRRVVFIFDEIHAGMHSFQEEYIFNLRAWKDLTHKCFVLSATFTEPARVSIEYISYLTDYRLHIVETERKKFPKQSNLHLYITSGKYSPRDLSLLSPLKGIVEAGLEKKQRVHIVTAFKELAEKLVDADDKENPLISAIRDLDPNLVTGISDIDFDDTASNIGTTFYTGIDLKHEDDVLVLIMPSAESKFSDKIGGIFTTGKVAISQAIARLRTTGDIYLFMPHSETYIEGEYIEHVKPVQLGENPKPEPYYDDDQQFSLLSGFYNSQRKQIEKEINKALAEVSNQDWNERAPLNYPSLGSFILNKGMHFLIDRYASYGKGFSPYIFWAALNDQFENTTLKSLTYVFNEARKLLLNKLSLEVDLLEYYMEGNNDIDEMLKGKDFTEAYNLLVRQLAYKRNPNSTYGKVIMLFLDGKHFEFKATPVVVKQAIVNILYILSTRTEGKVDVSLWVRSQIAKYQDKKNLALEKDPVSTWYTRLEKTRQEFCRRVKKNKMVATPAIIDDDFLYDCLEVIRKINTHDRFLRNKTYTFCRLLGAEKEGETKGDKGMALTKAQIKVGGTGIERLRNKVFQAYKSNFTESTFKKKQEALVASFSLIPDKHFFPASYKHKKDSAETKKAKPGASESKKPTAEFISNPQPATEANTGFVPLEQPKKVGIKKSDALKDISEFYKSLDGHKEP